MSNVSSFVKRFRDIMRNDPGINGDAQRIEQIAWMLFLKVYDTKEADWEATEEDYKSIIPEQCRWRNWAADDGKGTAITGDELLDFINKLDKSENRVDLSDCANGIYFLHVFADGTRVATRKVVVER